MEKMRTVSLSWLVVTTRDYREEYDWFMDTIHRGCYGLKKSERTDDLKSDLARHYGKVEADKDYYEGCVLMPELQDMDICSAAEYLRDWCEKNQINYNEDLDQYKKVEAYYWGYDDLVTEM